MMGSTLIIVGWSVIFYAIISLATYRLVQDVLVKQIRQLQDVKDIYLLIGSFLAVALVLLTIVLIYRPRL
jgi:type VI protein secretion system component VasK